MSITIDSTRPEWNRLYQMWLGQRKPGTLTIGDVNYVVATPNGEEQPLFIYESSENLYGSVSFHPGPDSPMR